MELNFKYQNPKPFIPDLYENEKKQAKKIMEKLYQKIKIKVKIRTMTKIKIKIKINIKLKIKILKN